MARSYQRTPCAAACRLTVVLYRPDGVPCNRGRWVLADAEPRAGVEAEHASNMAAMHETLG
jgi:hypothetical protein